MFSAGGRTGWQAGTEGRRMGGPLFLFAALALFALRLGQLTAPSPPPLALAELQLKLKLTLGMLERVEVAVVTFQPEEPSQRRSCYQ